MPAGLESHSPRLILASASPRRQELMKLLRFDFEVRVSGVPEEPQRGESPDQLVMRLARAKAEAIGDTQPDIWVIGADTVVVCGPEVMGKPESPAAAGGDAAEAERPHPSGVDGHLHPARATPACQLRRDHRPLCGAFR